MVTIAGEFIQLNRTSYCAKGTKMVSIDEMEDMLGKIAEKLPEEFFNYLNGGILLLPQSKQHPESVGGDLYILGEYFRDAQMGKYIAIYYGSFERVYGYMNPEELQEKLEAIVKHEFRHHLETLSGERGLEVEDEQYIEQYLRHKRD
jgi:hypothetical protein